MKQLHNLFMLIGFLIIVSGCGNTLTRTKDMVARFQCEADDFLVAKNEFVALFERQNQEDLWSQLTTGAQGELYSIIEDLNEKISNTCPAKALSRCTTEPKPFFSEADVQSEWGNMRKQRTLRGPITALGIQAKTHRHSRGRGVQIHVDSVRITDTNKMKAGLDCFIENTPFRLKPKYE